MGSGMHGGFGNTSGYTKAFPGTSTLVNKGEGETFGKYAKKANPKEGYTDVIIHGSQNSNNSADAVAVFHNNMWVELDQRRLSTFLKKDAGYSGGKIRLISCGTGAGKFAQNLANKMGIEVIAPSDTVWAWPNGKLTIGPTQFKNTGKWKTFKPTKNRRK